MSNERIRAMIACEIETHGANRVARVLDVHRATLLGYSAGCARAGSVAIIESRAGRLSADAMKPAAKGA